MKILKPVNLNKALTMQGFEDFASRASPSKVMVYGISGHRLWEIDGRLPLILQGFFFLIPQKTA